MKKETIKTTLNFENPESCEKLVTPFDNDKGEIIAESKVAKDYYMLSNAPDAGNNYEERRANLRAKIKTLLQNYDSMRENKYRATICTFYKEKSATSSSGRVRKVETISISEIYEFIPSTIEHTTNGDMKKGPDISDNMRVVTWITGTESGRAWTFVRIKAKYTNSYISKTIADEIMQIKLELNSLGIPAE
jgi:hypothetical protein